MSRFWSLTRFQFRVLGLPWLLAVQVFFTCPTFTIVWMGSDHDTQVVTALRDFFALSILMAGFAGVVIFGSFAGGSGIYASDRYRTSFVVTRVFTRPQIFWSKIFLLLAVGVGPMLISLVPIRLLSQEIPVSARLSYPGLIKQFPASRVSLEHGDRYLKIRFKHPAAVLAGWKLSLMGLFIAAILVVYSSPLPSLGVGIIIVLGILLTQHNTGDGVFLLYLLHPILGVVISFLLFLLSLRFARRRHDPLIQLPIQPSP